MTYTVVVASALADFEVDCGSISLHPELHRPTPELHRGDAVARCSCTGEVVTRHARLHDSFLVLYLLLNLHARFNATIDATDSTEAGRG